MQRCDLRLKQKYREYQQRRYMKIQKVGKTVVQLKLTYCFLDTMLFRTHYKK